MHEESKGRLETLFSSQRRIDAAAKAIEKGQVAGIPIEHFGISPQQGLNALEAKQPARLESLGVPAPALEAIVRLTGRPPLVVRNGVVEIEHLEELPPGTDQKIRAAEIFVASAGRVDFVNYSMKWGGTAWVVDKDATGCVVITNRHVAKLVARRLQDGSGVFVRSPITGLKYGASVDFNEEVGAKPEDARAAAIKEIKYIADDFSADAALFKITKTSDGGWSLPDPIPLADREGQNDELAALIGYPAYDSRNDPTEMERYFRGLYEVKRFAPGKVIKQGAQGVLSHDCTSLGGNSGSPLISLEQNKAIGLHFAGVYGVENSAVSAATIKQLLKGTLVPVDQKVQAETAVEAADGTHSANDLAGREGFDEDFLGPDLKVSWPTLPGEIEESLAAPSDATASKPHELRYTHFGVKFSSAYKLPVITAVNIDGENSVRIKRANDKWFFDERIPRAIQHGQKAFKDALIDRGHMVRREDPNWGEDAAQADGDTFHYTNAAPQHSRLNQGKTLWQGLENYILNNARTHGFKACVFTGPVFATDDPTLEEEGVLVPLEFWKVVAMIDSDKEKLHATAYLLSQGQLIRKLLEDRSKSEAVEGFVLGPYRTFQISIQDLEEATGYRFAGLREADPLMRTGAAQEAAAQKTPIVIPLETEEDLVL
jgi:endonuclease G, mitochondrial